MSVLWILRSWSSLVMWWMSTHSGLMEVRMLCNDLFLKTSNYFGRHVLWHIQLLWKLHSSNCALVSYVPLLDFGKLPSVFLFMSWETASLLHRAKLFTVRSLTRPLPGNRDHCIVQVVTVHYFVYVMYMTLRLIHFFLGKGLPWGVTLVVENLSQVLFLMPFYLLLVGESQQVEVFNCSRLFFSIPQIYCGHIFIFTE